MHPLGTVRELRRHPVKSLGGELCEAIELDRRGVVGDRSFAVRDARGKLGSGKTTRRFQRIDGLLELAASADGASTRVHFPDGLVLAGDDPRLDAALSRRLGEPVRLVRESTIPHMDVDPIHLLTTASLAWLADALPASRIDPRRFRANLLVECAGRTPVEAAWTGCRLRIGDTVELRVTQRAERCRMIGLAQQDLPRDPDLVRHVAREQESLFGVYAEVLVPGRIRRGDAVHRVDARA